MGVNPHFGQVIYYDDNFCEAILGMAIIILDKTKTSPKVQIETEKLEKKIYFFL